MALDVAISIAIVSVLMAEGKRKPVHLTLAPGARAVAQDRATALGLSFSAYVERLVALDAEGGLAAEGLTEVHFGAWVVTYDATWQAWFVDRFETVRGARLPREHKGPMTLPEALRIAQQNRSAA